MKKKGFTLVELLVVVAIIGILSVIMVPNVREQMKRAKVAKTKALIGSLETAIAAYQNDRNQYPASYDPQLLYIALTQQATTPYEPDSDETRLFRSGENMFDNPESTLDDSLSSILQQAGVPSKSMMAQLDERVFVDAWGNTIYYISHEEYNKSGRADFRSASNQANLDAPCAYELIDGKRTRPFKPTSFQIISFGPDGITIQADNSNGGIGSMIAGDKADNDGDGFTDHLDQVRAASDRNGEGNAESNAIAEDDVTNFM